MREKERHNSMIRQFKEKTKEKYKYMRDLKRWDNGQEIDVRPQKW